MMKKRGPLNILIDAPEADILCQVNGAYIGIYLNPILLHNIYHYWLK